MDFKNLFKKNDKAVSPLIGVILMVAVTVILAAAIGSSVSNLRSTQSSLKEDIDVKAAGIESGAAYITLEHLAGDKLNFEDSKAKITASIKGDDSIEIYSADLGEVSAGDVKKVELLQNSETKTPVNVSEGDAVNIKITDTETNQVVCDKDIKF